MNNKQLSLSAMALALMVTLLLAPVGCQPSETHVVDHIMIFKSEPGNPPPPSGWALRPPNPYPEDIQGVFSPGDEIFLGLSLSSDISKEITFSKYTFLNQTTGVEEQVELSEDLGPLEPGRTFLVGFEEPWPVPDEDGEYEVRLYVDDELVASALFNIGVWPASWGPEMEYFPAPIHEVKVIIEEPHPPPDPWVFVYIKGGLPDSCTTRADINCQYIDNDINIKVTAKRPKEETCAQVYGYFEEVIPIGGDRYISGETYRVNVNDYSTAFVMP